MIKPHSSKEDVLGAFAVEPDLGRLTLERYLRDFPEYAGDIVDLVAELTRVDAIDPVELLPEERVLINTGWKRFANDCTKIATNPFANLSTAELKKISETLGIKRSVLTAFRECTVIATSVPRRFMRSLADAIGCELDMLRQHLMNSPAISLGRSYKSDKKPQSIKAVQFEQLLIDAEVPEVDRKRLLEDD